MIISCLIETYSNSLIEDTKNERNNTMHASKYGVQLKYMEKSPISLYNVCVLNETNLGFFLPPFHKNYLKHFYDGSKYLQNILSLVVHTRYKRSGFFK